ncbi:uncharacterized protein [Periplaneta americana]|uniref:uncharacterized protein n=1 Tax=Periplaneta americana TaxID=6978 RepID=UPI0037E969BA
MAVYSAASLRKECLSKIHALAALLVLVSTTTTIVHTICRRLLKLLHLALHLPSRRHPPGAGQYHHDHNPHHTPSPTSEAPAPGTPSTKPSPSSWCWSIPPRP